MYVPPLIAIVDDNEDFRALMDQLLTDEGYCTLLLGRGAGAHLAIGQAQPAVVVVDLRLEGLTTGWDLLEALCADAATQPIPLILCSADTPAVARRADRLRELGCRSVSKPFDLDELLD